MPFISIIIPTRDRPETLKAAVESALAQQTDDMEVIVSDNASAPATRDIVESIRDERLRYVNTGRRVSMSDNWEFALGHASGKYLMFIGDDDAVVPGGIDTLRALARTRVFDAYAWPKPVYVWPIERHPAAIEQGWKSAPARIVNLRSIASGVVKRGTWGHYHLVTMYHSAVARSAVDAIKARTGRVFHATQPDVFFGMALPVFVERALRYDRPITVHGRSPKSNGGVAYTSDNSAYAKFMAEYEGYQLHPSLVRAAPPVANLTPDSVLVAMDLFPEFYGALQFGYEAMWACLCREAPAFKWDLDEAWVLRHRREIAARHSFHTSRFIAYTAMHRAIGAAKSLKPAVSSLPAPPDILTYVIRLGQELGMTSRTASVR